MSKDRKCNTGHNVNTQMLLQPELSIEEQENADVQMQTVTNIAQSGVSMGKSRQEVCFK